MGKKLAILSTLRRDTIDVDYGVGFKQPVVGSNQRKPVDKVLDELRGIVQEALPAPPPTAEELQRQEEVREQGRRWRQMASDRGGVNVPGG